MKATATFSLQVPHPNLLRYNAMKALTAALGHEPILYSWRVKPAYEPPQRFTRPRAEITGYSN